MRHSARVTAIVLLLAGMSGTAIAVSQPAGASESFKFAATVKAQTTLAKLNETLVIPPGKFHGAIISGSGTLARLKGNLKLPPATTTLKIAGIVLARVTVALSQTKKTVGTLNANTFALIARSTFDIHVVSVEPLGLPVNLVGNHCVTGTPVKLTFSGTISPISGGSVAGTYTIPPLVNCGGSTAVLNAAIAGPGNTFTATITPSLS